MITAYISIGNSDDKLTQAEWAEFSTLVSKLLNPDEAGLTRSVHGKWFSLPNEPWQNACWCVEIATTTDMEAIKFTLSELAYKYMQDSIAFAVAETEFIEGDAP